MVPKFMVPKNLYYSILKKRGPKSRTQQRLDWFLGKLGPPYKHGFNRWACWL